MPPCGVGATCLREERGGLQRRSGRQGAMLRAARHRRPRRRCLMCTRCTIRPTRRRPLQPSRMPCRHRPSRSTSRRARRTTRSARWTTSSWRPVRVRVPPAAAPPTRTRTRTTWSWTTSSWMVPTVPTVPTAPTRTRPSTMPRRVASSSKSPDRVWRRRRRARSTSRCSPRRLAKSGRPGRRRAIDATASSCTSCTSCVCLPRRACATAGVTMQSCAPSCSKWCRTSC